MAVSIPEDEEFERLLKDALKKPMKWYDERAEAERAVRASGNVKRRTTPVAHKA